MLKYLRIAVTALSLTACVLLIVLWVRSYSMLEWCRFNVPGEWWLHFQSVRGKALVFAVPDQHLIRQPHVYPPYYSHYGSARHEDIDLSPEYDVPIVYDPPFITIFRETCLCAMPIWPGVLITSAFSVVIPVQALRRFSLRTLLIATTLVAVALGIINGTS